MYKLAILISSFIFASASIFNFPDLTFLDESNDASKMAKYKLRKVDTSNIEDIWLVELNEEGLDFRTLRSASAKEEEIFERVAGPLIDAYKGRPSRVMKKDVSANEATGGVSNEKRNMKIKQEMMRLINKFVMSVKSDPDVFVPDSASIEANGPSLILFIRGAYTSLTVTSDQKQFHFFIPPPSPLPGWLYEKHDASYDSEEDKYSVQIPDYVRDQLYEKLLHLLTVFLSFPV